jgi:hypothetical protein
VIRSSPAVLIPRMLRLDELLLLQLVQRAASPASLMLPRLLLLLSLPRLPPLRPLTSLLLLLLLLLLPAPIPDRLGWSWSHASIDDSFN